MTARTTKPRIVAFELTRRCRLNCLHCRASAAADGKDPLSAAQCRNILEDLAKYSRAVVILTGGEPMMRDDIAEIVGFAHNAGHCTSMATCGYGFDMAAAGKLKQAGLVSLCFSIDGHNPQLHDAFRGAAGAFDLVADAVETAKKTAIPFQINTTITRENHRRLADIAHLAAGLGAVCWNPFVLVPTGRAANHRELALWPGQYETALEDIAGLKKSLPIQVRLTCGPQFVRTAGLRKLPDSDKIPGCLAAAEFAFISCTGDVQACGFLDISAGNLLENNFEKIWTTSPLLGDLRDMKKYKDACGRCEYLDRCRGCRARAFAEYGDYLRQDPMCIFAQKKQ